MSENTNMLRVTLELLPYQVETISQLFHHNEWDYKEIERQIVPTTSTTPGETGNGDNSDSNNITDFRIQENPEQDECPYCLCRPCVTDESNRQLTYRRACALARLAVMTK